MDTRLSGFSKFLSRAENRHKKAIQLRLRQSSPCFHRHNMHLHLHTTDRADRVAFIHDSLRDFSCHRQIRHQDIAHHVVRRIVHLVNPGIRDTCIELAQKLHLQRPALRHCFAGSRVGEPRRQEQTGECRQQNANRFFHYTYLPASMQKGRQSPASP